jgi:membrane protease YdiL (CAAX protease family)
MGVNQLDLQLQALNRGPIDQRLRFVVLDGEMQGPQSALKDLDHLDQLVTKNKESYSASQSSLRDVLRRLYSDYRRLRYDAPSVTPAERLELQNELGWFGELALVPAGQPDIAEVLVALGGVGVAADIRADCPDPETRQVVLFPAQRVLVMVLGALAIGVMFLFFGFCGLVLLGVLWWLGKLRGGLQCGQSPAGVYAETFALWMLLFGSLAWVLGSIPAGTFRLLVGGGIELLTLGVLAWPVVRGLPWHRVREDLGLTLGRRGLAEPFIGLGCYVLSSPLLFMGLMAMLLLTLLHQLLTPQPGPDDLFNPYTPSHPVVGPLARGDWWLRLQVFFLASIVAPIVEETMFRGVLYRHLRELTQRFSTVTSVILSVLISSFIFAIVHPQGILAVPALMALACGFALMREWRGTLVPSMMAHGFSNALVLLMNIGIMSD